jgi:mRNA interferase RelE/StbE
MLDITKDAKKFLDKLSPKQFKQITGPIIELINNPFPNDYKHLAGHPGYYRIDCGEYRICYKVIKSNIYVPVIGLRNDDAVYKKLDRIE